MTRLTIFIDSFNNLHNNEVNKTNKISLLEFSSFWVEYFKYKKYPHQRFGQAFYNTHVHDGIPNPDLFYTEDIEKAKLIIFDKYVEIPNVIDEYEYHPGFTRPKTAIDILDGK